MLQERDTIEDGGHTECAYRYLFESITEYAMFTLSPSGAITQWNAGSQHAFGYTAGEIVGRNFDVLYAEDDRAAATPAQELIVADREGRSDRDCWHVRKDGSRFWATNTVQPLHDRAGRATGYSKIVRDFSERYRATNALRESEERLRLLVETVRDYAIFSTSPDGTITLWNSGAARTFGYAAGEIVGRHFSTLFLADDVERGVPASELLRAASEGSSGGERWHIRRDGGTFFAAISLTQMAPDTDGAARGFVMVAHDITDAAQYTEEMRYGALHDALTGLPNRALFMDHLQRMLAHVKRHSAEQFAVLFVDVDNLKSLNDGYGHIAGDRALVETGRRLQHAVRPEDVVARLSGDEFAILLSGIERPQEAVGIAARIEDAFARPVQIDAREVRCTVSAGVVVVDARYTSPEDVLRDADAAMYEAKARGRNGSVLFDNGLAARS